MKRILPCLVLAYSALFPQSQAAKAAELAVLSRETWDEYAPRGKEVDCIYGDFVLRNDRIVVVAAQPIAGRNANMTVRNVGGAIIDLTRTDRQSDQLSAFYPGGKQIDWRSAERSAAGVGAIDAKAPVTRAKAVSLLCKAEGAADKPVAEVRYTLQDGWEWAGRNRLRPRRAAALGSGAQRRAACRRQLRKNRPTPRRRCSGRMTSGLTRRTG